MEWFELKPKLILVQLIKQNDLQIILGNDNNCKNHKRTVRGRGNHQRLEMEHFEQKNSPPPDRERRVTGCRWREADWSVGRRMKSVDKQVMIIILRSLPGLLSKLKLTRGSYVFPLCSVWTPRDWKSQWSLSISISSRIILMTGQVPLQTSNCCFSLLMISALTIHNSN